jgi:hypothetical protein
LADVTSSLIANVILDRQRDRNRRAVLHPGLEAPRLGRSDRFGVESIVAIKRLDDCGTSWTLPSAPTIVSSRTTP